MHCQKEGCASYYMLNCFQLLIFYGWSDYKQGLKSKVFIRRRPRNNKFCWVELPYILFTFFLSLEYSDSLCNLGGTDSHRYSKHRVNWHYWMIKKPASKVIYSKMDFGCLFAPFYLEAVVSDDGSSSEQFEFRCQHKWKRNSLTNNHSQMNVMIHMICRRW